MNYFLHKIDSNGLFIEDCFWDDGAYPETIGVPKMTPGSPAVPAVPAIPEQPATPGVQMFVGGLPATDEAGNPHWITPPKGAVPEVAEVPAIPEVLPMQEVDEQGNSVWLTAPVAAFNGNPIPEDMIAIPVPDGFGWPRWDGTQWIEGKTP